MKWFASFATAATAASAANELFGETQMPAFYGFPWRISGQVGEREIKLVSGKKGFDPLQQASYFF